MMSANEVLFGIVHDNVREILARFPVVLMKNQRWGGIRAIRFKRLQREKRQNYLRKISQTAVECFFIDGKVNVDGIIFANIHF